MDSARSRNFNIQRQHQATVDKLNKEWEISRSRIQTEQKSLRRTLDDIRFGPAGGSGLALPRGLTEEEKTQYLDMIARPNPSISLDEFDRQMAKWKADRQYMRYQGQALFCRHVHPRSGTHYLSPNKSLQISGTFRLQPERDRIEYNQGVTRPLSAIPGTGPPRVRRGSASFGPRRSQTEVRCAEERVKSATRRRPVRSKSTLPGY